MKESTTKHFFEGTVFLIVLIGTFFVGVLSGVAIFAVGEAVSTDEAKVTCSSEVK